MNQYDPSRTLWCGCRKDLMTISDFPPPEKWKFCPVCGARRPEEKPKNLKDEFTRLLDYTGIQRETCNHAAIVALDYFEKMLPIEISEWADYHKGRRDVVLELRRRIGEERGKL